jgi:glycosyltransferase involved in cell wall biosynthesis
LHQALLSCQAQSEPRWQAVVVDDHSGEPLDPLMAQLDDRRIQWLALPAGVTGVAAARNQAVAAADAQILVTLDADDIALPQRASRCLALLEPSAAQLIYTRVQFMDASGRPGAIKANLEPHQPALLQRFNYITNPGTAFTRLAWDAAGGACNPALTMAEDYELYLRMQAAGVHLQAIDEVHVRYRKHRRSLTARRARQLHAAIMQVRRLRGVEPFGLAQLAQWASPALWRTLQGSRSLRRLWRDDRWPRSLPEVVLGW